MIVDMLVEGDLDEAVARRLILLTGHQPGVVFGKQGVSYIQRSLRAFDQRARYGNPVLALVDFLDTHLSCPPELPALWLPARSSRFLLRAVVNEMESWLLADRRGIAQLLGLSVALIPQQPEQLTDPKQTLINLARRSPRRKLRNAMVPPPGVTAAVGPGYTGVMIEFVTKRWSVEGARRLAPSLDRCCHRLAELNTLASHPFVPL
ncbi:MAG: hypothetical protein RMN53_08365 [Anaerolineae bacterium]|nr:hypothetical protein [Anaerolineae bacterium]